MKRLVPVGKHRIDPWDLLLVLALGLLPGAYWLGYGLDWGTESAPEAEWDAAVQGGIPAEQGPLAAGMRRAFIAPAPEASIAVRRPPEIKPLPEPAPPEGETDEAAWSRLTSRLESETRAFGGRVGVYLKDLRTGRVWAYRSDDLFPSASLVKVPIMAAVFQKIHRGELTLDGPLVLRRRHRTGGSGSLKWNRDGSRFTVREILERMIHESDNTAMKMLIETVGFGALQQEFARMGLLYTEIYPEGLSLRSGRVRAENYTTARELAGLMERIYKGELVDRYSSELMLDIMKHLKARARLAKALPVGWEIAHKTGLLRGACHDAGVIFTPKGDFLLTVLTGGNKSYSRAKDFITRLGVVAYRHYGGYPTWTARAQPRRSFARRR